MLSIHHPSACWLSCATLLLLSSPFFGYGPSPFLVLVETTSEISEHSINANLLEPILVFKIRILMEVEVQVQILISESVRMHLHILCHDLWQGHLRSFTRRIAFWKKRKKMQLSTIFSHLKIKSMCPCNEISGRS